MTSLATICSGSRYYIEFKTDNPEAYKTVQEICRLYIDREKQTPKKVKFVDGGNELRCPCCNYDLMGSTNEPDHDPPYCFECGQALDWSDEE